VTNLLPHETNEPPGESFGDRDLVGSTLNFRTYSFRETLFAEFDRLVEEGRRFDGLIVDLMQTGFSIPVDTLVKFHAYGRRLLKPQGVCLFITSDAAMTLTKDDPGGGLTMNVYDSPFGIFARYPMLADYVCATVSGIDRRRLRGGGNTLANHILFTSFPILTPRGIQLKNSFELPASQNWLLQLIDDYTTSEGITRLMEARHNVHQDESLRLLQELEADGIIYPVFPRIQFLANCYHNRKPFRLGRYMVAAGILTPSQLEELLELQQQEGLGRSTRTFLGVLAVRKGYINTRELEVLLHDQFIFGGYHKVAGDSEDSNLSASQKQRSIETMRDAMIGSLGAIDSAGLLQSLSTAKKTGLLTVEHRDKALVVSFTDGKPTQASMDNLKGYHAMVEFLVMWTEGIFVFRDKSTSRELESDECKVTHALEKLLLDAALHQDNNNRILKALPGGRSAILERVWNFAEQWEKIPGESLKYFDGSSVQEADRTHIVDLARQIDGLTTLDEVIKTADDRPSYVVLKHLQLLLDNQLVSRQQTSLFRPLTVFQRIVAELQQHLGKEDNKTMLQQSLLYVHGDATTSLRFHVDFEGRVSVNLSQVKSTATPVSIVLLELRRWMEAYLAHVRRHLDPQLVDAVVAKVVQSTFNR
jgi:Domain of unknown function (DUF4388)